MENDDRPPTVPDAHQTPPESQAPPDVPPRDPRQVPMWKLGLLIGVVFSMLLFMLVAASAGFAQAPRRNMT